MIIRRLKSQMCLFFSIFRAVYLDTQGDSTNFLWLSGIIMDINRGYLSKIGLIFFLGLSRGGKDAYKSL